MSRHDDIDLDDLFRAARDEQPPQRWREQRDLFRLLRLGGPIALLATRVAGAFAALPPRAIVGATSVALVGSLAAGATYLAAGEARSSGRTSAPPSGEVLSAEHAPVSIAAPNDAPAEPAKPAVATTSVDALPSAPRQAPRARSVTVPSAIASPEDDLARELASVSAIRAKIAAHEDASARRAIRAHRATFAHGALAQEVSVLEIEALRGLGDDRERCRVGRAFLAAHPTSAYRERVLALTGDCNHRDSSGALHDEPPSSP